MKKTIHSRFLSAIKSVVASAFTVFLLYPEVSISDTLRFDLPIRCKMGADCFIQNYVDVDPSDGRKDYKCGDLSYDDHKGTDFRLLTLKDMEAGVPVLAAADGIVVNLRTNVADHYFQKYDKETQKRVKNIGLGNVVILKHLNGYSSVYAHMKSGSVQVKKGDKVRRGDVLGNVGMSGFTEFPHLHFSIHKGNAVIDPFSGPMNSTSCTATAQSLWTKEAQAQLSYQKSGFLISGFSDRAPADREDIESGDLTRRTLPPDARAIVFFSYLYGLQKGDILHYQIIDPQGDVLVEKRAKPSTRHRIVYMGFVGKKHRLDWQKGIYVGEITIERGSEILADSALLTIR